MFNFTFATGIALVALLVHLLSVSAFTLADGGFGNNLHLLSFSNTGDYPLGVRQLGQGPIPTECDSVCYPVISLADAGCTAASCCTSSFVIGVFGCFSCLQEALQRTNYSEAQTTLDGFYNACIALGYSLPLLTFPGQDPDRPLSSLPSSGSSTSSITRSSTIPQTTVTGTTSTASQTVITSLPGTMTTIPSPTSITTSFTPSSSTLTPNSAVKRGSLWLWVQMTGIALIFFLGI